MLLFLATVLEQLDLALEHINKRDVHNGRFGLMLTDNAIELVLHQIANDKKRDLQFFTHKNETYAHQKELNKALGKSFKDKTKFARLDLKISIEEENTINIMHEFRNELYHAGLAHEAILPSIAPFYFKVACEFIGRYRPMGLGWGSNQVLPERAKKYFSGHRTFPGKIEDFSTACDTLAQTSQHTADELVAILADHIDMVIEEQNICIDIIASGVYVGQQTTRDKAVVESQAWSVAFSEEGKDFAAKRGWTGSVLTFIERFVEEYPFVYKNDVIPGWNKQARNIRRTKNPHAALKYYNSFMNETENLRETLQRSAAAAEAEIDRLVDEARGK